MNLRKLMRLSGGRGEETGPQKTRHATGQLKKYKEEKQHIPSKRIEFGRHNFSVLLSQHRRLFVRNSSLRQETIKPGCTARHHPALIGDKAFLMEDTGLRRESSGVDRQHKLTQN